MVIFFKFCISPSANNIKTYVQHKKKHFKVTSQKLIPPAVGPYFFFFIILSCSQAFIFTYLWVKDNLNDKLLSQALVELCRFFPAFERLINGKFHFKIIAKTDIQFY